LIRVKERPRKEKAEESAARVLRDAGCDVFLPMMNEAPLFGGYIFAKLEDMEVIRRSRSMSLPEFYEIDDSQIELLRDTKWNEAKAEPFIADSKVRIISGPFNYREAIVKAKKADRIIVLLNMLNSEQEITLKLSEVEAA